MTDSMLVVSSCPTSTSPCRPLSPSNLNDHSQHRKCPAVKTDVNPPDDHLFPHPSSTSTSRLHPSPDRPLSPLPRPNPPPQKEFHEDLVFNCTPCHPRISSLNTSLTNRCCRTTLNPLNLLETTSIAYMDPHPPEISCTYVHKPPSR